MGLEEALQVLAALEQTNDQLWQASKREGEGWKQNYLGLRREFQAQTSAFAQMDCAALGLSEGDEQVWRAAFCRFRSAAALHQGKWSVVDIAAEDPEYRQSVEALRTACLNFITVMRRLLGRG